MAECAPETATATTSERPRRTGGGGPLSAPLLGAGGVAERIGGRRRRQGVLADGPFVRRREHVVAVPRRLADAHQEAHEAQCPLKTERERARRCPAMGEPSRVASGPNDGAVRTSA